MLIQKRNILMALLATIGFLATAQYASAEATTSFDVSSTTHGGGEWCDSVWDPEWVWDEVLEIWVEGGEDPSWSTECDDLGDAEEDHDITIEVCNTQAGTTYQIWMQSSMGYDYVATISGTSSGCITVYHSVSSYESDGFEAYDFDAIPQ